MRTPLALAALILACASHACAWSHKEHMQLTRIAAMRLLADPGVPAEMKAWLRSAAGPLPGWEGEKEFFLFRHVGPMGRGADGLAFWAIYPDLAADADKRERKLPWFNVPEAKLHYIDVEYFSPDPAKRRYADDLSGKPTLADFPRDINDPRYAEAGVLPFAVEHCYRQLVANLRAGRLDDKPGQFPRDEHAARWAGCLAHYAADNFQPHHATMDYKSRSYFGDDRDAPDIHADIEYRLGDDLHDDHMELRREYWDLLTRALNDAKDPVGLADLWQATIQTSLMSYDALPMIGRAAKAAYADGTSGQDWRAEAFFHFKGDYLGRPRTVLEMKALQQAMAVKRIEALWRKAWGEAHR